MIDADIVNVELPERGDMQSHLQHAWAALCLRHKPSETIDPECQGFFQIRSHLSSMPFHGDTQRYVVGNAHA